MANDQKEVSTPCGSSTDDGARRQPPRKVKKLYHKKSRTGCATCRSRRVKCDEIHPICGNCERYGVECFYDRFKPVSIGSRSRRDDYGTQDPKADQQLISTPGRSSKHLLELRLMHHFIVETVDSLPTAIEPHIAKLWREHTPLSALENSALLDTICALAALHLKLTERSNDTVDAHYEYLDSALRGHRQDIDNVNLSNVDAVWYTSSLLRFTHFAKLQERSIQPYQLPEVWLSLMGMAGPTFSSIWALVKSNPEAEKSTLMLLFRDSAIAQEWRRLPDDLDSEPSIFPYLLDRVMPRDEFEQWNSETRGLYRLALANLNKTRCAIDTQQPISIISMRHVAFLALLPTEFSQLILNKEPRALVVFAHYFALMVDHTDIWTIGATPQREISGLASMIPEEWQPMMQWPLSVLEDMRSMPEQLAT